MARPVRTHHQVVTALGNVGYEVWMCCEQSAALLESRVHQALDPSWDSDAAVHNALIEAHLLHARSLTEFLVRPLPPQPGAADMLRTDFTPGVPDWTPAPSDSVGWLSGHWQDLNRHLSHLSWDRGEQGPP